MFGALVRGGQVTVHGWRMLSQLVRIIVMMVLTIIAFSIGWQLWQFHKVQPRQVMATLYVLKADTLHAFSPDSMRISFKDAHGNPGTITLGHIRTSPAFRAAVDMTIEQAWLGITKGGQYAGGMAVLVLLLFWLRGRTVVRKTHLKGSQLVTARQLRAMTGGLFRRQSPYGLAGIRWPQGREQMHTLIIGTTGSGKTVCISNLLEQIEQQGDKAIVYDKMGSFIPHFYRPERDFILNPFDDRGADWCLFSEATTATDFTTIAAALIPEFKDTADPFWTAAARMLFATGASSMWKKGDYDMKVLTQNLVQTDMKALARLMKGTEMQSIIDEGQPKTALSVRSVLTTNIQPLRLLQPVQDPFSVRRWVQDDDRGGFLFLSSHAATHEVRRSQISTQIELAIIALLSMERNPSRRVFFIIDELPSLHKVPSLISGLREIRQFGGCFVLGAQVFSEIRDLYGREAASSISGNCNTRLSLSSPDRDTAQWMSDNLGRAVTQRMNEGFSYGAETFRDGVTHTTREDIQPIVLPADIMNLPPLQGYLKMPFDLPVARVQISPRNRKVICPAFSLIEVTDLVTSEVMAPETGVYRDPEESTENNKTLPVGKAGDQVSAPEGDTTPTGPPMASGGSYDHLQQDQEEDWISKNPQGPVMPPLPPPEAYERDEANAQRRPKPQDPRQISIPFEEKSLPTGQKPDPDQSNERSDDDPSNERVKEILETNHPQSYQAQKPLEIETDDPEGEDKDSDRGASDGEQETSQSGKNESRAGF